MITSDKHDMMRMPQCNHLFKPQCSLIRFRRGSLNTSFGCIAASFLLLLIASRLGLFSAGQKISDRAIMGRQKCVISPVEALRALRSGQALDSPRSPRPKAVVASPNSQSSREETVSQVQHAAAIHLAPYSGRTRQSHLERILRHSE